MNFLWRSEDFFLYSSDDRFLQRAKISIGNGGLEILFISEILPKCGDWHVVFIFKIPSSWSRVEDERGDLR